MVQNPFTTSAHVVACLGGLAHRVGCLGGVAYLANSLKK